MELHYLLREPQKITNETPVLFLLHGYGSNEEDLFSFVPNLPENWLVVSFRAPYNTQFGGYCWYDINFDNSEKFIDTQQANQSLNLILSTILEISNKFGLTHNPNHLCGFSQGGILSYALALSVPDIFRKIACLSCYPEEKILNKIIKDKKKI